MLQHRRSRNGVSAALALAVGLAAAALLHRPDAPPVYDGISAPPEPYRWISPPPNLASSNQPPGNATFAVPTGHFAGTGMQAGDGQVVLTFGPGSLQPPAGATSIACTIDPLASPTPAPAGVQIRGNVYRLAGVGLPGSGAVSVNDHYSVRLRYPPGAFDRISTMASDGNRW